MIGTKDVTRARFFRADGMRASVFAAILTLIGLGQSTAFAATTVRIGTTNTSSDVTFFIADKKGYFKDEGIEADFIPFDSAAKMIAPLSANQLDVGGGSVSAGLYNAVARKIDIKIVADKGSMPPNYGFMSLLVRKDLIDSGRFKSYKDLKGLKAGVSANGSGGSVILYEALKKGGLSAEEPREVTLEDPSLQAMAKQPRYSTRLA